MPNSLPNPTTLSHSSLPPTALALKLSVNFPLFFLIFRDTHSPFAARPTLARVSILGSTPSWPTLLERQGHRVGLLGCDCTHDVHCARACQTVRHFYVDLIEA